jgi:hypothetical protein
MFGVVALILAAHEHGVVAAAATLWLQCTQYCVKQCAWQLANGKQELAGGSSQETGLPRVDFAIRGTCSIACFVLSHLFVRAVHGMLTSMPVASQGVWHAKCSIAAASTGVFTCSK